jgi:hypothetical protein
VWEDTGRELVFLAQFYCHPDRLPLDALCIQLYQNSESYILEDDVEYEPYVTAVVLPHTAPQNLDGSGRPCPSLQPFDIKWEYREDPNDFGQDYMQAVGSKLRGTCCMANYLSPNEQLLITLEEYPLGLNFGGNTLLVIRHENGEVEARLDR